MAKRPNAPKDVTTRAAKASAAQKAATKSGPSAVTIGGVIAILTIIAVVAWVIIANQKATSDARAGGTAIPAGASVDSGYRAFADVTPAAGAPVVDLFEDFQCPVCGQLEAAVGKTFESLAQSGKITLNYHVLNFLDEKFGVKYSVPVANGAFCAADQGKFQAFHDAAYAGQTEEAKSIPTETLDNFATMASLTGEALRTWQTCVKAEKYSYYVGKVTDAAVQAKVSGTPTVKINGTEVSLKDVATPDGLTKAIEAATT